jgi:hypothetical protein
MSLLSIGLIQYLKEGKVNPDKGIPMQHRSKPKILTEQSTDQLKKQT